MGILNWLGKRIRATDGSFWTAFYGGSSYAGKSVTPESALTISAVWSCVRLISETIATLPLGVYREDRDGRKQADKSHPLYRVLHDLPNADFTAAEFWEGATACLLLWGNAYAEKYISDGQVRALTLLRPEYMSVRRANDGSLEYVYSDANMEGRRRIYSESEIFHIRGFGVGLDVGLSPITYARHSLGSVLAADEAAGKMFANGVRPTGILTIDQVLTKEQRSQVKANIVEPMAGSSNAGGIFTLEAGMKFQPISMNPEDAQMLETRSFHVEEVCRWFRVPPFMIGHTEKSTSWGTGLEQQNIAFLTYALRPYLTRIEQAVKRQLIKPEERASIYAEFNLEGLLRADSAGRAALYSQGAQNGWITRNEIRAKENLHPIDGGDVLTVQSALVPLDQLGQNDDAQDAKDAVKAWLGIGEKEKPDASV